MISVLIPVKDGGEGLRRCLEAIAIQRLDEEVEVVIVDSGATDGSVELARSAGARVHEIPPSQFNHGSTRNLAAGLARGDVLVFTSQDAYAPEETWLAALVAPLAEDGSLAGAYGRQIAHLEATPPERFFMDFLYGEERGRSGPRACASSRWRPHCSPTSTQPSGPMCSSASPSWTTSS